MLAKKYSDEIDTFLGVCHKLSDRQYVTSHGGNLAWKLEQNLILITPTKMAKGSLTAADLVFIDMNGNVVEGTAKPTGEVPMYLRFFGERPDIVSIIHCHPPYACAASVLEGPGWLERPLYPEAVTEVGPVPLVPYAEPLTDKLADNFAPFLQKYNHFIMQNHGLVSMSTGDIEWTFLNVELLEGTAQSVLIAQQAGSIREMTRQDVQDLENTMRTRSLPLPGAPGVNPSLAGMYFS